MSAARGGLASTSYTLLPLPQARARSYCMAARAQPTKAQQSAGASFQFSKFQGLGNDFLLVGRRCCLVFPKDP